VSRPSIFALVREELSLSCSFRPARGILSTSLQPHWLQEAVNSQLASAVTFRTAHLEEVWKATIVAEEKKLALVGLLRVLYTKWPLRMSPNWRQRISI
jgi:hypothetical protein